MDYTFYVQGSHRMTTVSHEHILSAARDAAFLLDVTQHQVLLWLPPTAPLAKKKRASEHDEPVPPTTEPTEEVRDSSMNTLTFTLEDAGRSCFPLFLQQAKQHWRQWQQQEMNHEARLRSTLMTCGAIDAIYSTVALEHVRTHLLNTSGVPVEIEPPAFEVALQELVSLQTIFSEPYDRVSYQLFLCVLTFACLAVPAEQPAIDRLRDALTVVEQECSQHIRQYETEEV